MTDTANLQTLVDLLERRLLIERTQRKKAEAQLAERASEFAGAEELRRARDEAVAASSAKSAFLANMSHEIRTPLTSIIGFAELLLQPGTSNVDPQESLLTIIRNGRHLLEVIDDILDLAKIETRQVALEQIDLPLPELLRDVRALVAPRAEEKALEFVIEPHLPLPPVLRTDPVRLKQVLLNFLGNAIKFTPRGTVTLALRYLPEKPALRFTVTDTGIGMSGDQLAKLFQPFTQADVSTTRKFGGTGLGLYISGQLATLLDGRIEVASREGQGSTFQLDIAMAAVPPKVELLTSEEDLLDYRHADFVISSIAIPDLSGRVLLAEDGADNQRLLSAYLRQAGLSTVVVGNGRDAVETALRQDFDLVLMDIQMPVMDGVAATSLLRASGYAGPIVALTANVMKSDVQRYMDTGCNDVLAKPVDRDSFYAVVGRYIGMARTKRFEPTDPDYLREMEELRQAFIAGLPEQIAGLRAALRDDDWATLTHLAHTLKGTAGSYGFGRLTEIASQVEDALRGGHRTRAALECERLILEGTTALRRSIGLPA
jgi:signal transduction histidine kinase/HPt (histidine-containing phosphotransfer) domain-containing protein